MASLLSHMSWDDIVPKSAGTGHANDASEWYSTFMGCLEQEMSMVRNTKTVVGLQYYQTMQESEIHASV